VEKFIALFLYQYYILVLAAYQRRWMSHLLPFTETSKIFAMQNKLGCIYLYVKIKIGCASLPSGALTKPAAHMVVSSWCAVTSAPEVPIQFLLIGSDETKNDEIKSPPI
jgi:hypothetical protein